MTTFASPPPPGNTNVSSNGTLLRPQSAGFSFFITGATALILWPATGAFGQYVFFNAGTSACSLLAASGDTFPSGGATLNIPAGQSVTLTDIASHAWSQIMAFEPGAATGVNPIVPITGTVTLTMPAQDTDYPVTLSANGTVTLPATTGGGKKLTFDLKSLSTFTLAFTLYGSDAYEGSATLPALVSGASFALRDIAAGTWAIE